MAPVRNYKERSATELNYTFLTRLRVELLHFRSFHGLFSPAAKQDCAEEHRTPMRPLLKSA